jgi:acetolactate synthase small subunit
VESSAFEEMNNIVSAIEITVTDITATSIAAELTTTALELLETADKAETITFESETLLEKADYN